MYNHKTKQKVWYLSQLHLCFFIVVFTHNTTMGLGCITCLQMQFKGSGKSKQSDNEDFFLSERIWPIDINIAVLVCSELFLKTSTKHKYTVYSKFLYIPQFHLTLSTIKKFNCIN